MRSQIYRHSTGLIYYDLELDEQIIKALDDTDLYVSTSLTSPDLSGTIRLQLLHLNTLDRSVLLYTPKRSSGRYNQAYLEYVAGGTESLRV
jgi:hypothetical protein